MNLTWNSWHNTPWSFRLALCEVKRVWIREDYFDCRCWRFESLTKVTIECKDIFVDRYGVAWIVTLWDQGRYWENFWIEG